MQPRLALTCLLAACVGLGSAGCATTSRATPSATPAPEPVAQPAPAPEPKPKPAPAPAKAERPKSPKRSAPKPVPEVKTPVAARTPEPRRHQPDGANAALGTPSEPVPFAPSTMTRPQRVSGREPQLTPEARAARVRGTALVRCVVTREGQVKGCKLLNGLPHMDQELLEAVSTWRVTPVTAQGKPLDAEYTFAVRIPQE